MNEVDLSYTAGIIDGEGSIQIQKHRRSDYSQGYHYAMSVSVQMVDPEVPLWLKQTFKGSLGIHPAKGNRRAVYTWTITTNRAATFLGAILPYLKIKRGQAEIALEFQQLKQKVGHRYCKATHKPLIMLQAEAILAQKITEFHHKGREVSFPILEEKEQQKLF